MDNAGVKPQDSVRSVFAAAIGLWSALVLVKFGNPVILDGQIAAPAGWDEFLVGSWPMAWGYGLTAIVVAVGLRWWRRPKPAAPWLLLLPAAWLAWQALSASQTIDRTLTVATMKHFCACVAVFYLGAFGLATVNRLRLFWFGLIGGFIVVLVTAWRQEFGGLEETRRYFFSLENWRSFPPEFIQKVSSDRIYGTLFYPNALAGVILLLLPVSLGALWGADRGRGWGWPARWGGGTLLGVLGLGCLYWSGSKAGWLIALLQVACALLLSRIRSSQKGLIIGGLVLLGLTGFWLRYQGYFSKGATSVSARFDYWEAAGRTLMAKPILGSGPGTFGAVYTSLKRPEAEVARLAHNDYLEQGSDSGWPALVMYCGWVFGGLWALYRRSEPGARCGAWLGLVGLAVQGFVEFWLYIPAIAWPAFLLMGWLTGVTGPRGPANRIDRADSSP